MNHINMSCMMHKGRPAYACRVNNFYTIYPRKNYQWEKIPRILLSFTPKQISRLFSQNCGRFCFVFEIYCSLCRYTYRDVHIEFLKCLVCAQPGFWGPIPLLLGILLLGNMDPFSLGCLLFGVVSFDFGDRLLSAFFLFSWVPYFWETNWAFWGRFLRKMKAFPSTSLGCRLVWRITGPRRFLFFLSSISLANYVIAAKIKETNLKIPKYTSTSFKSLHHYFKPWWKFRITCSFNLCNLLLFECMASREKFPLNAFMNRLNLEGRRRKFRKNLILDYSWNSNIIIWKRLSFIPLQRRKHQRL